MGNLAEEEQDITSKLQDMSKRKSKKDIDLKSDDIVKKEKKPKEILLDYYRKHFPDACEVVELIKNAGIPRKYAYKYSKEYAEEKDKKLQETTSPTGRKAYRAISATEQVILEESEHLMKKYNAAFSGNITDEINKSRNNISKYCINNEIKDVKFIKFLIDEGTRKIELNKYSREQITSIRILRKCWGYIVSKLEKKQHKEIANVRTYLNMIYGTIQVKTTQFLIDIIQDSEKDTIERTEALEILNEYVYLIAKDEKFKIVFKLIIDKNTYRMQRGRYEYPHFLEIVKDIIRDYADINYADCIKKLDECIKKLDKLSDPGISEEILKLIRKTISDLSDEISSKYYQREKK